MSKKLRMGRLPVSIGAYALFFRVPSGFIGLGALVVFFQVLFLILLFSSG